MIYFPKSRYQLSHEDPVAAGSTITNEGQCLVASTVLGVYGVAPSGGNSGEKFLGFAASEQLTITSFPKIESFVQPSTSVFTLQFTPQSDGVVSVWDVTTGAVIAQGGGGWTRSVATLTFQAATNGHTLIVTYRYAPTTLQAQAMQGDNKPGGAAGLLLGQVGVIKSGTVYTSEYDTGINWMQSNPSITTGANGRVTVGGSGAVITGVVISAPNASGPDGAYLGIEFTAA